MCILTDALCRREGSRQQASVRATRLTQLELPFLPRCESAPRPDPYDNIQFFSMMASGSNSLSEDTTRPKWFTRRNIEPFTINDDAVEKIINDATHAVVSWVTKDHKPASAVMLYRVVNGVITITSTTNRAKYHAWRRNPSACFCIWEPGNIGRQVTLRGTITITKDDALLREFTKSFLSMRPGSEPPTEARLLKEIEKFDAPDRHMMQLTVEKTLTHDLNRLFDAESTGEDVWG
jgi:pyridoxine/pyridoxamine 5'-phosphate oxidase